MATAYKYKYKLVGRDAFERGAVTFALDKDLDAPDGALLGSASGYVDLFVVGHAAPLGVSQGDIAGNGVADGAVKGDVIPLHIGDTIEGTLIDAIPTAWYGTVIYPVYVASGATSGWRFSTSNGTAGAINLNDILVLHDICGNTVGDTVQKVRCKVVKVFGG